MEFLIECSIKVLLEECIRELEPLEGHLRRLAVLCSDYVRTSCSKLPEREPAGSGSCSNKNENDPECSRTDKELSLCREARSLCIDESDIAGKVPYILRLRTADHHAARVRLVSTLYCHWNRRCLQCDIHLLGNIIV